jgi:hypothetical protein
MKPAMKAMLDYKIGFLNTETTVREAIVSLVNVTWWLLRQCVVLWVLLPSIGFVALYIQVPEFRNMPLQAATVHELVAEFAHPYRVLWFISLIGMFIYHGDSMPRAPR